LAQFQSRDVLITPHPLAALRAAADCRKCSMPDSPPCAIAAAASVRTCAMPSPPEKFPARESSPPIAGCRKRPSKKGHLAADVTPLREEVDGIDDCVRVVREHIGLGADLIKVSITGRV
jgi:hypothetical protein